MIQVLRLRVGCMSMWVSSTWGFGLRVFRGLGS